MREIIVRLFEDTNIASEGVEKKNTLLIYGAVFPRTPFYCTVKFCEYITRMAA